MNDRLPVDVVFGRALRRPSFAGEMPEGRAFYEHWQPRLTKEQYESRKVKIAEARASRLELKAIEEASLSALEKKIAEGAPSRDATVGHCLAMWLRAVVRNDKQATARAESKLHAALRGGRFESPAHSRLGRNFHLGLGGRIVPKALALAIRAAEEAR